MGFWEDLGVGAYKLFKKTPFHRLIVLKAEFAEEQTRYEALLSVFQRVEKRREACVSRMAEKIEATRHTLQQAQILLFPPGITEDEVVKDAALRLHRGDVTSSMTVGRRQALPRATPLAVGAGVGTTAAIAAWSGVQMFGFSSTGTAIGGLHGAAAMKAGWALFGGGSLATGGGGIALGQIVLPGLGLIIGAAAAAIFSHQKANKVEDMLVNLRQANAKNGLVIRQNEQLVDKLERAEKFYDQQDQLLGSSVQDAQESLFRFGWFSKFLKCLRYLFTGRYYSVADEAVLARLNEAVWRFMDNFGATT
jgi:hypothetical protein